jgi:hypothetical protein
MIRGHKNEDLTELFDNFHGKPLMGQSVRSVEHSDRTFDRVLHF